jgi:hypothetical protein
MNRKPIDILEVETDTKMKEELGIPVPLEEVIKYAY